MTDLRRELNLIRRRYREHTRNHGETIVWFEYVPHTTPASAGSQYDDVYDEGPSGPGGKKFKNGVVIPVLTIAEREDEKRAIPEGRQPVELTNFVASVEDFRSAGIQNPYEYQNRLNDMFLYDGRYFSVYSYKVRGRLRDDVLILVEGFEIYINQELPFDPGPQAFTVVDLPWPSTIANL